ncbi:phage antirepressor N-terminal domain-containing protein [Methylomicrobium sp. Wu6]|uniref:phage antirepressor N-terminal domain-containing protein n=1 Tax=Methylomicrobium sp. Wu6 TaxID=3107928 RepID=UPI002DD662DF|nr:phage antirepressor N-terminal domain-containing protein [Methylomicrobium sp. Wu6]MEC4750016.1 phage antirepressor N-terminal domain-containing protein [Methylomicrobium sp. Wu6]
MNEPQALQVQAQQLETVWFHEHAILIANVDKTHYVAMKPIVESMGLAWNGQFERIKRDPILSTCIRVIRTQLPGDAQSRELIFLSLDFFHGWLFTIDASRVKPQLQETILVYQRECYRVLAEHFSKRDIQEPVLKLQNQLQKTQTQLTRLEAFWFAKYPHWRTIRADYYTGYPFSYIAKMADKSVSACRRAVKSMEACGLINPRYAALHRMPDGQYRLWLQANPQLGW